MSYQITLNSRNVLVPLSLETPQGERITGPLSRLDTATAMVIRISSGGSFTQEFIPLGIERNTMRAYPGTDWVLWSQKTGSDLWACYLGIPDRFFAVDADGVPPRSISVQVVGTSPLTGREEFSGGVDVALQAEVAPPLIPGFLNLGERFFPTLLPHNFIERHAVDSFEFGGRRGLLLMAALQADPSDRVPVSLGKHWEPKNWIHAAVENLAPAVGGGGYFTIRGGCFYGRNRKITHWFGGEIGLGGPGFRQAASDKIRAMGPNGNGAWVFWLEFHGNAADQDGLIGAATVSGSEPAPERRRISVRHPMLHGMLVHGASASARSQESVWDLPAGEAVAALAGVARVLVAHQDALLLASAEPTHAAWSERREGPASALMAYGPQSTAPQSYPQEGLEADIRALYREHGETLRALESVFDETFGYSAWDAVGNPMREMLARLSGGTGVDAKYKALEG